MGAVMIVALMLVLWVDSRLAPYYPFLAVVAALVVCFGSLELGRLLARVQVPADPVVTMAGSLVIVASNWLPQWTGVKAPTLATPLGAFVVVSLAAMVWRAARFEPEARSTSALLGHLFCYFYLGVLGSFLVQLRWIQGEPTLGAWAVAYAIFTTKSADIGAYFAGRAFGRRKMAPKLSPGKTWEGLAGGLLAAMVVSIVLAHRATYPWGRGVAVWVLLGASLGAWGCVGDLLESMIKRDAGLKDASHRVPGFGGVLDIVDSILLNAPIAYVALSTLSQGSP